MDENVIGQEPQPSLEAMAGTAKKYIRTLEGDIKAVEKGDTPDLAPLASPDIARPTPIHTYSGDFSNQVKDTGATTATIIAAEQDAAPAPVAAPEEPGRTKKNIISIIGGILLVALGLGAAGYAYVKYAPAPAPIIKQEVAAPIFVDERQEISGNGILLLQAIEQSVTNTLAPRTVRFIYTASSTTQGFDIFSQLPLSAPDIVKRNVNAESSMAGVVNVGASQTPFFILSVATYRDTFAGMLSWEGTMVNNLSLFFPAYPAPIVATTTPVVATTTPVINKKRSARSPVIKVASTTPVPPVYIAGFRDEVVANHDVRIYRDARGQSVLIYGYWDQQTLIIARDPQAFSEIITRLATTRTK